MTNHTHPTRNPRFHLASFEADSDPLMADAADLGQRAAMLIAAGRITPSFGRGMSMAEIRAAVIAAEVCQLDDPVTREAMELRSNVISAALKGDDLEANERAELWQELAEVANWLQKDNQQIGDYADAQLCARFGNPL
jgi:hypothetical protein